MTGIPLSALAHVVRSKNAGPTQLTIDIFFNNASAFDHAAASAALAQSAVAALYRLDAAQVQRHLMPHILAMKFTLPRRICAGTPGDGDVYGAQQHTPMLEVLV